MAIRNFTSKASREERYLGGKAYFESHRAKLLSMYEGQYVAIIDGKVVDHDTDYSALADRVFAKYGPGSIFIPRVSRQERAVNLPGPSFRPRG